MLFGFSGIGKGQVTIWTETFTYSNGTITGQGSPAIATWTASGVSGGMGVEVQTNQLRGRNTTAPSPDRTTWSVSAGDPIEINGYNNVSISINLSETGDFENEDFIQTQYSINGGAWTNFATNGYINNDFGSATATQTGLSGNTLAIRILMTNTSDSEYYFADNVLVTGECTPAQPGIITGNSSPCQGSTQLYSVTNVSGVTYTWSFPSGWTITAGQGTNSVSVTTGITNGNIQVTPSNACGNGPSRILAVTTATTPAQPSSISGTSGPCIGSNQIYSVTNVSGTTYSWTFPVDWILTAGQGTNSATVTVGLLSGTISTTPSNACGTGTERTLSVTTTTIPGQSSAISGTIAPCAGTSQDYNVTEVAGITFTWAFPSGWTITNGQGTNNVSVTAGSTSGNVSVTPSNACGNGPAQTLALTPDSAPAQPDLISGNTVPCQNSSQIYSVLLVPDVIYTWAFPAGWTITAGQNTNSVTVTAGSISGNISVTPSNVCGNGTARTLAVTVSGLPAQPGTITPATAAVCMNSTHNFLVLPAPPSGVTYTWAFPGATILSGQGTNVIQLRFGNQSGDLTVTPSNACGTGPARSMAITVIISSPAMPGSITGEISPCTGSAKVYAVSNISGLTYTWAVPAGWSITAGQGTNSISTTVGATAGNISVIAGNACGGSSPRTLAVTPQGTVPAQPSAIAGSNPVCQGSTHSYSVTSALFVTYNWVIPGDWNLISGQGTNSIVVLVGALSGNISVTPSNDCGAGIAQTRNIVVDTAPPAATSAITGNNNPCEASSQTYSVINDGGLTYTWTFPADWTINTGQGSNSVTVTTGSLSGNIIVTPSNGCGNGPSTNLAVNIFLLPFSAGSISGDILFCEGTIHTYSVNMVTGINYEWTVPAGWAINSGQGTNTIEAVSGVNSGSIQVIPQNACGTGPGSSLNVTVNPLPAAETGPDGAICVGAEIVIGTDSVPGNTYSWTSVPPGFTSDLPNPLVQPDENTTYTLVETNPATGCSNSNNVTILANQIIVLTANPTAQTICTTESTSIVLSSNISGTIYKYYPTLTVGTTTTGFAEGIGPLIIQTLSNPSGLAEVVSYQIVATAAECENPNTIVDVTINPAPQISDQTPAAICSDAPSGVTLGSGTNGVSVASYSIISINSNGLTASAGNPVTGDGFAVNEIADDAWTNTTVNPVNVVYAIQGVSNQGCPGNTFTVTLVINPEPIITNSLVKDICSGSSTNINLTSTLPSSYTWTIGSITGGITGAAAGSGATINQTLTNPDNATAGMVEYMITPVSTAGSCQGSVFTITVTVYPAPVVNSSNTLRICSGTGTNLALSATTAATFSWTIGAITGGITGASADSGPVIDQVLTNPGFATYGTVEYNVTATSINGGCVSAPYAIVVTVDPIPTVSASAVPESVCPGTEFDLLSSSSLTWAPTSLLSENFNGVSNDWTKTNNSTGGTPANAAWTLRADGYQHNNLTFHSNDGSQFYLSSSYAQGGNYQARTYTYLRSESINASLYNSLSLEFYHYFAPDANQHGYVQVSTDGTNWVNVADFTTVQGASNGFEQETINLTNTYAGSPVLYIQFYFYARTGFYWAIDNVTLNGTSTAAIPIIAWTSTPLGFASSDPNPANINQAETTIYTVSYTNPISLCSADASVTVTTLEPPDAAISADYCAVPGKIRLTATGGGTYLWNTGQTTAVIEVDIAGQYSVTVTGANGCTTNVSLGVSTELVINGTFSAGNVGFTSGYVNDQTANGLYAPESEYAIYYNAQYTHTNFWGYDHTTGSGVAPGNFMIINGAKYSPQPTVWQQTISVVPNTDYYFSAWAISLNNVEPFAQLQFRVNSVQVGTIASLTTGVNNNNNPWLAKDRFYGTWNSGSATTAVIQIIDLETAAGGNDFGLDDISFGTLSPIPFTFSPSAQGGTNLVCEGETLQLNANISGGMAPYVINWSGPNGFTSNLANPAIPNVTVAAQGTYQVTIHDSYGCTPQTDELYVTINPAPNASVTGGGNYCQYAGSPFIWFTGSNGTPPFTFEYNINGGLTQSISTWGSDFSAFVFAPTNELGTFTYNITGVSDANGCSRTLSSNTTVIINALPSAYITGDWVVCPNSTGNLYTGNSGMTEYDWSITGNGSIPGTSNTEIINVTAGDQCGYDFSLTLLVTDDIGCNATAEELILVEDNEIPTITGTISITPIEGCSLSDLPSGVNTVALLEALGPEISDNCSSDLGLVVTHSDNGPNNECPIETIRIYTITDACGNSNTITQTFNIDDTTGPVFTFCPTNVTIPADPGSGFANVTLPAPIYSDNCSSIANLSLSWIMTAPTAGSGTGIIPSPFSFNTGTTSITYTATDECGNETACEFTVTVEPNDPPDITCSADINQNASPGACSSVLDPAEPTINAGAPVSWSWTMTGAATDAGNGPIDDYTFPVGTTTITWTATNASGTDVCIQTITIEDNEAPAFTIPAIGPGYCVEGFLAAVYNPGGTYYADDLIPERRDYYILTNGSTLLDLTGITDNCPGTITINWTIDFSNDGSTDLSGSGQLSEATPFNIPLGDNLITWTVTDSSGNIETGNILFKVLPRPDILD